MIDVGRFWLFKEQIQYWTKLWNVRQLLNIPRQANKYQEIQYINEQSPILTTTTIQKGAQSNTKSCE